jgi:hypothetical protein
MNAYQLANEELKRMIEERDFWLVKVYDTKPVDSRHDPFAKMAYTKYLELDKSIKDVRKNLFDALQKHDHLVQEKVAELVLTSREE